MSGRSTHDGLDAVARHLRAELETRSFVLLYAFNGTGKTRLSSAFKTLGKTGGDDSSAQRDTLYFNAFTEDLFVWDNDLENDSSRRLQLNAGSRFFDGLESMEMDTRIRRLLDRYADFEFRIDTDAWEVTFAREFRVATSPAASSGMEPSQYETRREESIKVSRGEENIFIWCFFLAVMELALDDDGAGPYSWVKYIYIDDPVSSLDEHNAIAIANHLAHLLARPDSEIKAIISTHHTLFFNVLCNELKKARAYLLSKDAQPDHYFLEPTDSTPFLQHLAALAQLDRAQKTGQLFTYHFNMLRRVMEQTASFFGLDRWSDCITMESGDPDVTLLKRLIDIMSHGDYSLFEPKEMLDENKRYFRAVFTRFVSSHPFNPALFASTADEVDAV